MYCETTGIRILSFFTFAYERNVYHIQKQVAITRYRYLARVLGSPLEGDHIFIFGVTCFLQCAQGTFLLI